MNVSLALLIFCSYQSARSIGGTYYGAFVGCFALLFLCRICLPGYKNAHLVCFWLIVFRRETV